MGCVRAADGDVHLAIAAKLGVGLKDMVASSSTMPMGSSSTRPPSSIAESSNGEGWDGQEGTVSHQEGMDGGCEGPPSRFLKKTIDALKHLRAFHKSSTL